MNITGLHIYGYGKFHDVKINFPSTLTIVYGENEAGKSTVFSFIHAILFGFPARNQTNPNYEPQEFARYGGSITIKVPGEGQITIERVKRQYKSEVRVLYSNGKTGGEDELKTLLTGMDRTFFQSIYTFNLEGLQQIYRLDEAQLGKYLFYSGIAGSDKLWETEQHLQKQMDSLFKPGGKKPILNQHLLALKNVSQALKKAREQENDYNLLRSEVLEAENRIAELQKKSKANRGRMVNIEEQIRVLPFYQEKEELVKRKNEIGPFEFPVNGGKRLETVEASLIPQSALMTTLEDKLEAIQKERESTVFSEAIIEKREQIELCADFSDRIELFDKEISDLSIQIDYINQMIEKVQQDLHMHLPEDEILALNTGLYIKEEIQQIELLKHSLHRTKTELDQRLESEQVKLEQIEARIDLLKQEMLLEDERASLLKKVGTFHSGKDLRKEKQEVDQSLIRLTARKKKGEAKFKAAKTKSDVFILTGCLTLLAVSMGLFWFSEQLAAVITMALTLLLILLFIVQRKKQFDSTEIDDEIDYYSAKSADLERQINTGHNGNNEEQRLLLDKDNRILENLQVERIRLEEQEQIYHSLIDQFELWEQENRQCEERVQEIGKQLNLSTNTTNTVLQVAFEKLDSWKQSVLEKHKLLKMIDYKKEKSQSYRQYIVETGQLLKMTITEDSKQTVLHFKQALSIEEERKRVHAILSEKEKDLLEQLLPLREQCRQLEEQKMALLQTANCRSIEEFYEKAQWVAEWNQLSERIALLNAQIGPIKLEASYSALLEMLREEEEIEANIQLTLASTREELASTRYKINQMEKNGTVDACLHEYNVKLESFRGHTKEWMKIALAQGILKKTIKTYEEDKLPAILQKAEDYIVFLTKGKYEKMVFSSDGSGVMLFRNDGVPVKGNDLSRGTAEMVYTAIRLSFAQLLEQDLKWPIIMDDSFVNFDKRRAERTFELLKKISDSHQIIFFTCHEHLRVYFNDNEWISLEGTHHQKA